LADETFSSPVDFWYLVYPAKVTRRKTCAWLDKKSSKSKRNVEDMVANL
jgi:hypothetical protein